MIPFIIYYENKKVWENPMLNIPDHYDATRDICRIWVNDPGKHWPHDKTKWTIVGQDEFLGKYWKATSDNFFSKEEGKEPTAEEVVTVDFNTKDIEPIKMSLEDYVNEYFFMSIIEDIFQLPFIEETKELSDQLTSGKYSWNVSPDICMRHDKDEGWGYDT